MGQIFEHISRSYKFVGAILLLWRTMPENSINRSPCAKASGDPYPLGKDPWIVHCKLLGMTLVACELFTVFAFTVLAILLT